MIANELRINNLINFSETGDIFRVVEISPKGFRVINKNEDTWIEEWQFEGVLLTKEWLLKLGAKKNQLPNGYWISVTNLKAEFHFETFDNTDEIVTTLISQSCELILDRVKYVHEYQNLYYALTKCELSLSGI